MYRGFHDRDFEAEGYFYDKDYLEYSSDDSDAYDSDDNNQLHGAIVEAWRVQGVVAARWDPTASVERLEAQIVEHQVSSLHDSFDALWAASLNDFRVLDHGNALGIPRVEADTPTTRMLQRLKATFGFIPPLYQNIPEESLLCTPAPSAAAGRFARHAKSYQHHPMDLPVFHGCCNLYQTAAHIPPAKYNSIAMSGSVLAAFGAGFMGDPHLTLYKTTMEGSQRVVHDHGAIEVDTGFYCPGAALTMTSQHVWVSGDSRIKSFDLSTGQLHATLFCGHVNAGVSSIAVFQDTLVANCRDLVPSGNAACAGLRVWTGLSSMPRQSAHPTLEDYEVGDLDASAGPWLDLRPQYGGLDFVADNPFAIEVTVGAPPSYTLPLNHRHVSQVVPYFERGVLAAFSHSTVFGAVDLRVERLSQRFFGHLHPVQDMFTSPARVIATCDVHHAYLWDARTCTPTARYESVSRRDRVNTAVAVSDDGNVIFVGGTSQSIVAFDVRNGRGLYELTTGNNDVHQMLWDGATSSLVAATTWTHCNSYCMPAGYRELGGGTWPDNATHLPSDFGRTFDAGQSCILQYEFTSTPDAPGPQTSQHPVSDMW